MELEELKATNRYKYAKKPKLDSSDLFRPSSATTDSPKQVPIQMPPIEKMVSEQLFKEQMQ
jgi:hypothetical protein